MSDNADPVVAVAENWEDEDPQDAEKAIEDRFKQVRILQRKQADKAALIEKSKAGILPKETITHTNPLATDALDQEQVEFGQRKILRRPESKDNLAHGYNSEAEKKRKAQEKTFEERQAAYNEARSRILGSDYNPDTEPAPAKTPVVTRSTSPETIVLSRSGNSASHLSSCMPPSMDYQTFAGNSYISPGAVPLMSSLPLNFVSSVSPKAPNQVTGYAYNPVNAYNPPTTFHSNLVYPAFDASVPPPTLTSTVSRNPSNVAIVSMPSYPCVPIGQNSALHYVQGMQQQQQINQNPIPYGCPPSAIPQYAKSSGVFNYGGQMQNVSRKPCPGPNPK